MKLPQVNHLRVCLIALKKTIGDDYRSSYSEDEDTYPGMDVTIGADEDGNWAYQTGDNSYMGTAYYYPHWAVIELTRRSNCTELARDVRSQIAECGCS